MVVDQYPHCMWSQTVITALQAINKHQCVSFSIRGALFWFQSSSPVTSQHIKMNSRDSSDTFGVGGNLQKPGIVFYQESVHTQFSTEDMIAASTTWDVEQHVLDLERDVSQGAQTINDLATKVSEVQAKIVTTRSMQFHNDNVLQELLTSTYNNGWSINKLITQLEGVQTAVRDLKNLFKCLFKAIMGFTGYVAWFLLFFHLWTIRNKKQVIPWYFDHLAVGTMLGFLSSHALFCSHSTHLDPCSVLPMLLFGFIFCSFPTILAFICLPSASHSTSDE